MKPVIAALALLVGLSGNSLGETLIKVQLEVRASPQDTFSSRLNELMKGLESLNKESDSAILYLKDTNNRTLEDARREVSQLREGVVQLLHKLRNDGELWSAIRSFQVWTREHSTRVRNDDRFEPDEKSALMADWKAMAQIITDTIAYFQQVKDELTVQLDYYDRREDLLAEFSLLERARTVARMLQALSKKIEEFSENLRRAIEEAPHSPLLVPTD